MALPRFRLDPKRLWLYALSLIAGVAGGWWCFGFGRQIGGLGLAWLLALNGGAFGALITASALDWVAAWATRKKPTSPEGGSAR